MILVTLFWMSFNFFGIAGIFFAFGMNPMVLLGFLAVIIISLWKIFTKARKPGWAAIVPIYNIVILAEIVGFPWYLGLLVLIPGIGAIALFTLYYNTAFAFGKNIGFGVGLVFLPMIFLPILAFDKKSQYVQRQSNQA